MHYAKVCIATLFKITLEIIIDIIGFIRSIPKFAAQNVSKKIFEK